MVGMLVPLIIVPADAKGAILVQDLAVNNGIRWQEGPGVLVGDGAHFARDAPFVGSNLGLKVLLDPVHEEVELFKRLLVVGKTLRALGLEFLAVVEEGMVGGFDLDIVDIDGVGGIVADDVLEELSQRLGVDIKTGVVNFAAVVVVLDKAKGIKTPPVLLCWLLNLGLALGEVMLVLFVISPVQVLKLALHGLVLWGLVLVLVLVVACCRGVGVRDRICGVCSLCCIGHLVVVCLCGFAVLILGCVLDIGVVLGRRGLAYFWLGLVVAVDPVRLGRSTLAVTTLGLDGFWGRSPIGDILGDGSRSHDVCRILVVDAAICLEDAGIMEVEVMVAQRRQAEVKVCGRNLVDKDEEKGSNGTHLPFIASLTYLPKPDLRLHPSIQCLTSPCMASARYLDQQRCPFGNENKKR